MEVLYLGVWCEPFHDYWAVPTPNIQCSAALHHLIVNAVFNISSDLMLISIALSISIRNQLSISRKIILSIVFGLGVFTVLSAVLNKYYSFHHPFGSEWTYWYVRESSTAMIVSNLPFTWSLLRRIFKLAPFNPARSRERPAPRARSPGTPPDNATRDNPTPPRSFRLLNLSGPKLPQVPPPAAGQQQRERGHSGPTTPDWRGAGVFGLQDADALASGIWEEDRTAVHDDGMDGRTLTPESVTRTLPRHDDSPLGHTNMTEWFTRNQEKQGEIMAETSRGMGLEYTDTAILMF
jgi:hypothetical protein